MEYKEVKAQSEEMLKQILSYINKTGISDEEYIHLVMELAATLTTNVCIDENLEKSEKLYCNNFGWLLPAVSKAIHRYFEGNIDYQIIE